MANTPNDSKWHLDRRVPLALIIVLLGQMVTGVWWASTLDSQVDHILEKHTDLKGIVNRLELSDRSDGSKVIRLEEKFVALDKTLSKQGETLEAILQELRKR